MNHGVVINHQDYVIFFDGVGCAIGILLGEVFYPCRQIGCLKAFLIRGFYRQVDGKCRSVSQFALNKNIATHHFADSLADCKPQARASIFQNILRMYLGKTFKQSG